MEQAIDVMTTSEVGDDRTGRRHEQHHSGNMVARDHAVQASTVSVKTFINTPSPPAGCSPGCRSLSARASRPQAMMTQTNVYFTVDHLHDPFLRSSSPYGSASDNNGVLQTSRLSVSLLLNVVACCVMAADAGWFVAMTTRLLMMSSREHLGHSVRTVRNS